MPTSSTRPSATVLVVDDDKGVTQTFARMLRFEGIRSIQRPLVKKA